MKTLLISTALFTGPLLGSVTAQTTTSTLTKLVSEQDRQIKELKTEIESLRSRLNLERRKNGKVALSTSNTTSKTYSSATSHTVKAGDTFSSISRKYGVSVSALIIANPTVKPSKIAINQKLVIPHANSKAVASAPKVKTTPKKATLTSPSTQTISTSGSTYKVSKGDTFYAIAKKHKISLASLSAANPSLNPNKLKIGQTVRLTKSASTPSKPTISKKPSSAYKPLPKVVKKATPKPTPAKPKAVAKTTPKPKAQPKSQPQSQSYAKQSGDIARTVPVSHEITFEAFAKQHGTTISVLNALNGLDLPADEPIPAGSELFVPNK